MTDPTRLADEYEFLEAALGELAHLRRTHPDRAPDALSSFPRLMAMLGRYGSRMVDPTGPARVLHPATAWRFDPATGDYIAPAPDVIHTRGLDGTRTIGRPSTRCR